MRVAVTGATGVIGGALVGELRGRGDEAAALSRDAARARERLGVDAYEWKAPKSERPPLDALRGSDAVVNLLGETMRSAGATRPGARSGTRASSRRATSWRGWRSCPRASARACSSPSPRAAGTGPAARSASTRPSRPATTSSPGSPSTGKRRRTGRRSSGVRVVLTRTGVVLSESGGALEKMLPFFKLGIGGPVAGGDQYVPWIHLDDVVGALLFALDNDALRGPVNLTAPEPVTNKELSRTLGRVLHRPAFAPVPALAVKTLYGEMASIVTTGQRAVPTRLEELGYEFRRPDLEQALRAAT